MPAPDVPPLVLTRDELTSLTGLRQPKRMEAWLLSRSWVFEAPTRRGDVPKVDRAYYLARMSGQQPAAQRRQRVNTDWMFRKTTTPA